MFTGIVEEMGRVLERVPGEGHETLVIAAERVMTDLAEGHSICVSGVCLTVVDRKDESFAVDVVPETLQKSDLGNLYPGSRVNLERAMGPGDRFHGHVVQGHVETVGQISDITTDHGDVRMTVAIDQPWMRYCISKGSIALDGVSLTIADVISTGITVALIPYTLDQTTLGGKLVGEPVNVETDILARYVERFLETETDERDSELGAEELRGWGYGDN